MGSSYRRQDLTRRVFFLELVGRGCQPDHLDMTVRNRRKHFAHGRRGRCQFPESQFRENEPQIAADEGVHESPGMNAELLVRAAANDRRVRVDSAYLGASTGLVEARQELPKGGASSPPTLLSGTRQRGCASSVRSRKRNPVLDEPAARLGREKAAALVDFFVDTQRTGCHPSLLITPSTGGESAHARASGCRPGRLTGRPRLRRSRMTVMPESRFETRS